MTTGLTDRKKKKKKEEVTAYYNISQRRRKLIEKAAEQRGSRGDKGCSEGGMHEKTEALNERKTRRPSGSLTQTRPKQQQQKKSNNNYCPTSCSKVGKTLITEKCYPKKTNASLCRLPGELPMSPKTPGCLHNWGSYAKTNVETAHKAGARRFKSELVHTTGLYIPQGFDNVVWLLCNYFTRTVKSH